MFVDYGALEFMAKLLTERKETGSLRTFTTTDHRNPDQVYVSIAFHQHPHYPQVPCERLWDAAQILFTALLSPAGHVDEAKYNDFPPDIFMAEVRGHLSADEAERLSQEAVARFRAGELMRAVGQQG